MPEDKKRLAEYDLARQLLVSERGDEVEVIAEQVDEELAACEQHAEELGRRGMAGADLDRTRAHVAAMQATFTASIERIDEALALTDREQEGYRQAMARAARGERIVWHSSRVGAGWLPERFSLIQHGMEVEPAWQLGVQMGTRYVRLREAGKPASEAILAVAGLAAMDLTGITNGIEALSGSEALTGRVLPGPERTLKGVLGVVSVASLIAAGGPRIGPFGQAVRGTRVALVQAVGPLSRRFSVILVGEGGAVLALTQAESLALAQAGLLQMVAVGAGGNGPPPVAAPGLKGFYGKTRGGGSARARAYQKKVTGRDDSVFVNGVEFDGWRAADKTLVDAKLAKGKGSWYDVTGDDSFTRNFKRPEIIDQAKRQEAAMQGSGAVRIEWIVSDPFIVRALRDLFRKEQIKITLIHAAP